MTLTTERKSHFDTLESVLDQTTLADVLAMLARICHEKASHIQENWQDDATAKVWGRAGDRIATCAQSNAVREVR